MGVSGGYRIDYHGVSEMPEVPEVFLPVLKIAKN
jgi:hypothetical protein